MSQYNTKYFLPLKKNLSKNEYVEELFSSVDPVTLLFMKINKMKINIETNDKVSNISYQMFEKKRSGSVILKPLTKNVKNLDFDILEFSKNITCFDTKLFQNENEISRYFVYKTKLLVPFGIQRDNFVRYDNNNFTEITLAFKIMDLKEMNIYSQNSQKNSFFIYSGKLYLNSSLNLFLLLLKINKQKHFPFTLKDSILSSMLILY